MGGSLAASKVNEEAKGVDVVKTEEEIVYRVRIHVFVLLNVYNVRCTIARYILVALMQVIDFGVEAGFDHLNFHKLVEELGFSATAFQHY